MKIVVFDLDETLGYFTQYGIFWDSLAAYMKELKMDALTQPDFDAVLDLFPEFLRPDILPILTYLKHKKKSGCCHKMMIYTNNTGPREWAKHIIQYFERKLDYKLVDQIIAAFKINGKRVEPSRTTHNKTHADLIKCAKIPADTEICFMDDCLHPEMTHSHIYYIKIQPYYYHLSFDYMLDTFAQSAVGRRLIDERGAHFYTTMKDLIDAYRYTATEKDEIEYDVEKILSKRIISHLHAFFSRSKTAKLRHTHNNKTVKRR